MPDETVAAVEAVAPSDDQRPKLSDLIPLETPIRRGDITIGKVAVREPDVPTLMGLSLRDLMDVDTKAVVKILPRITEPPLTLAEVATLRSADLFALGVEIAGFLLPWERHPDSQTR